MDVIGEMREAVRRVPADIERKLAELGKQEERLERRIRLASLPLP